MPAEDISLTATYKPRAEQTFALNVLNGSGSGQYFAGTQVTIVAASAPEGQVFDRWTGDVGFVASADLPTTDVTMPEASVTVEAAYKDAPVETFALTVNSGSGSGEYRAGRAVSIAADPAPDGQVFDRWTGDTAHVETPLSPNTTVVMPSADVAVTATYKNRPVENFELTMGFGSGSGSYPAGQSVTIAANPAPDGQVFDRWRGQTGFLTNPNAPNTEVVMPSESVSVTASYRERPAETFALSVTSGTGSGDYEAGEVISIAAEPAEDGQVFVRWSGQTAQVANVNLPNTTLSMPAADVSVSALYEAIDDDETEPERRTLTVVDGTGDGDYRAGRVVLIAADVREGEIFDRWVGQTAGVNNVNIPNTTLVMPDANVTVTATFKPDPELQFRLRQQARLPVSETSQTESGKSDPVAGLQIFAPRASREETSLLDERNVPAGRIVRLTAPEAPAGFVFDKWVGQTTHVDNIHEASTFLYMPTDEVDITATYRAQVTAQPLTVESGTGSGEYLPGTEVTISANAPDAGFVFERWEGQTAQMANVNRPSTTLRMPQTSVRVRAVYRDKPEAPFRLTVRGNDSVQDVMAGETVTITSATPGPDEVFARWTGQVGTVDDIFAAQTALYMPATEVTVQATFATLYTVTAGVDGDGGTLSPASQEVVDGERAEITLTPNDGWIVDEVTGCGQGGSLSGTIWTTGQISADCALTVRFTRQFEVSPAGSGSVSCEVDGDQTICTATPMPGFAFVEWTNCPGIVQGNACVLEGADATVQLGARFERSDGAPIPVPVNPPLFLLLLVLLTFGMGAVALGWRRVG